MILSGPTGGRETCNTNSKLYCLIQIMRHNFDSNNVALDPDTINFAKVFCSMLFAQRTTCCYGYTKQFTFLRESHLEKILIFFFFFFFFFYTAGLPLPKTTSLFKDCMYIVNIILFSYPS